MKTVRLAALKLHSLHKSDQVWMLDRLPESKSNLLREMLSELQELGIPVELGANNYKEFDKQEKHDYSSECKSHDMDVDRLKIINEIDIDSIIDNEPVVLIAGLLTINEWSWVDSYLNSIPKSMEKSVREEIDRLGENITSELQEAMIDAFIIKKGMI